MKLDADKTKEIRLNFCTGSSLPPIMINYQAVNVVDHVKLLGVTFSNDLKWNMYVDAVCK